MVMGDRYLDVQGITIMNYGQYPRQKVLQSILTAGIGIR